MGGPGTGAGALLAAGAPLPPEVAQARPGVGRGLGSEQLPRLLGVSLLEVVPLVHLARLKHRRVLPLLLKEGLQLQLLLLLELPGVIVLQFLHCLLLLFMDDLRVYFL